MRYKLLGRSGLRVSELCLGAMTFGEEWGWGSSRDESRKVFEAFAEAGGTFIDTANVYTNGTSETFLGEFLEGRRERFVLATKYTSCMDPENPNAGGNQRRNMVRAVEASLKRLQTDYVDLYWLHAWDFTTPVDEVMRAFDDLVRAGKVLYVGISDAPAWIISEANMLAELRGWSRFVGLQIQYSLISRHAERDLLPMARARDLAVTPWGVLGSGVLSGKYKGKAGQKAHSRGDWGDGLLTDSNLRIAEAVEAVAGELDCTASQVALAWVRQQPYGVMIPILGARRLTQLEDNLGCLKVQLDDRQLARLDEVSRIEVGFPHDFLGSPMVKQIVFGNTADRIDNHHG
jgi:aryl-alcohol dehydrogenase-like predicted oxidoreductase